MTDFSEACGFIFDCDGTLLDSMGAWDRAEQMLFEAAGPLAPDQEDRIHAAPIEEAARILHEEFGAAESPQAILDHLDSMLMPYYRDEAEPLPGVVALVRALHGAGVPCVVVSSSPVRYLQAGLSRAGIADCFEALISTEDCGISKQEPGIYALACEVLGCDPGCVWAVDDAPYALRAMGDFGLRTLGVGNGCSEERRRELQQAAAAYAESLEELL